MSDAIDHPEIDFAQREVWQAFTTPILVTLVFNMFLLGVNVAMTLSYLVSIGQRDRKKNVAFVSLLMLCNLLTCAGNIEGSFATFVVNAGEWDILEHFPIGFTVSNFPSPVVVTCCQAFYTMRAYRFSKSKAIAGLSVALILGDLAVSMAQLAYKMIAPKNIALQDHFILAYFWLSFVTDAFLASSFIFFLLRERRGFSGETDAILVQISKIAFQSSFLTVAVMLGGAIAYMAKPSGAQWLPFFANVAPTYSLSVLYALSRRPAARPQTTKVEKGAFGQTTRPQVDSQERSFVVECTPRFDGVDATESAGLGFPAPSRSAASLSLTCEGKGDR